MSRIKKALEKAKAQGAASDVLEDRAEKPVQKEKSFEITKPVYSRTKVIDVPAHVFMNNKIFSIEESHPVADQFKLLRTRIFRLTRKTGQNAIQISGFGPDEGKSTVALNLAVSIARDARQTTLLVDLDFRKPSIHKMLGLGNDVPGLKQYFENRLKLEDIFICPGIKKLTILPAGGVIPDSTEVMGSPRMEALVMELKLRYPDRYIIFDTPGLNVCPDPLVFSEYVDGVILVARSDHTSTKNIKAAVDLLPREKLLGTVLNDSRWEEPMAYSEFY